MGVAAPNVAGGCARGRNGAAASSCAGHRPNVRGGAGRAATPCRSTRSTRSVLTERMPEWHALVLTWLGLQDLPPSWEVALGHWRGIYSIPRSVVRKALRRQRVRRGEPALEVAWLREERPRGQRRAEGPRPEAVPVLDPAARVAGHARRRGDPGGGVLEGPARDERIRAQQELNRESFSSSPTTRSRSRRSGVRLLGRARGAATCGDDRAVSNLWCSFAPMPQRRRRAPCADTLTQQAGRGIFPITDASAGTCCEGTQFS
jgi:hypothetical protein